MTNYTPSYINNRLARNNFVYQPFPGKFPVRLLIEVKVRAEKRGVDLSACRYFYNGKWSFAALRTASRIVAKSSGENVSVTVVEYCRTGVLYNGSLIMGTYHPARARILYHPDAPILPSSYKPWSAYYSAAEATPIRFGGKHFLVMNKVPEDKAGLYALKRRLLGYDKELGGFRGR